MSKGKKTYFIGNQTLSQYCKEHGLNFATVRNRIYTKGLTPEEAVKWQRVFKTPEEKAERVRFYRRQYQRPDRRNKPIERKYCWLPVKVIKEMGYAKQTKYFGNGMRLSQWCKKNGVTYAAIMKRMHRWNLTLKEAITYDTKFRREIRTTKSLDRIRAKHYKTAADFYAMFGGAE
jgi:hypothetical protein